MYLIVVAMAAAWGCSDDSSSSGDTANSAETSAPDTADTSSTEDETPLSQTCPPAGAVGTAVGDTMENLTLMTCDGRPFEIHSTCGADATLLFLYHGWCNVCNSFLGVSGNSEADMLYEAYSEQGLEFLYVVVSDHNGEPATAEYCSAIRDAAGLTMNVVYDAGGDTLPYGTNSQFIVLDEEDVIVYSHKFNVPLAEEAITSELADEPLVPDQLDLEVLTADFADGQPDNRSWFISVYGSESSMAFRDGVAVATAGDSGAATQLVRSVVRADPKFRPHLQAMEADVRIATPSSDGAGRAELGAFIFNNGLFPGAIGVAGHTWFAVRLHEDGKVTAVVVQCTAADCSTNEVMANELLGDDADPSAWQTFRIACDPDRQACFAQWGDNAVVTIPIDEAPYQDPTWHWLKGVVRVVAPSKSTVTGEIDNVTAGSISEVFGSALDE